MARSGLFLITDIDYSLAYAQYYYYCYAAGQLPAPLPVLYTLYTCLMQMSLLFYCPEPRPVSETTSCLFSATQGFLSLC